MLLFLVLAGIPPCFDFYVVTHSYSSRPFLCALGLIRLCVGACIIFIAGTYCYIDLLPGYVKDIGTAVPSVTW